MEPSQNSPVPVAGDESLDAFMGGRLRLIQSRSGYRFSIDAILLARFVTVKPGDVVLDLGTGCGVMLLILLLTRPVARTYGIEIQAELASQAARNAALNGFTERMAVIRGDIRHCPLAPGSADVVIVNPPYRRPLSGRINPDPRRAIARHELLASLSDILASSVKLLRDRGRLALVYPAARLGELLGQLARRNLEPKRLQLHHPGKASDANLVLVEAARGARPGLRIHPPIIGQGEFAILKPDETPVC